MKFNPKNAYGQSIVVRDNFILTDKDLWHMLEVCIEQIKEFMPMECLRKVKWEVIPYLQPGMENNPLLAIRKNWKVIMWRYQP